MTSLFEILLAAPHGLLAYKQEGTVTITEEVEGEKTKRNRTLQEQYLRYSKKFLILECYHHKISSYQNSDIFMARIQITPTKKELNFRRHRDYENFGLFEYTRFSSDKSSLLLIH